MKTPLLVFGLACLGILAGGCASKMDVTGDPRFSAGWVIGGKYALINDVYLHKDASASSPESNYLDPKPHDYVGPDLKPKSDPSYVGPVFAKTRIEIVRLRLENNVEAGQAVYPYAKILDGEFSGREARLGLISRSVPLTGAPGGVSALALDPDYLAPIPDVK